MRALLAPAPALLVGAVVMHSGDVPQMIWQLNLVAGLVGVVLASVAMARATLASPKPGTLSALLTVGLILLSATLLAPGTDGVHRWLPAGPIRVHGAALLLPALLVVLLEVRWRTAVAAAPLALVVLLLQPDAAQAGSFAAAWIAVVLSRREGGATAAIVVALMIAGATLLREDPLAPVPHVEGIIGMAADQGRLVGIVAALSLVILPLSLAAFLRRPVGIVLGVYTAGTLVAASLGHYPVPILGYGISPILGYYGAIAIYARMDHRGN